MNLDLFLPRNIKTKHFNIIFFFKGVAEVNMRESKKLARLRIGSRFTYQDVLDGLVWFESEEFVTDTKPDAISRQRRGALEFVLSDGRFEKQGSIEIDVSNDLDVFDDDDDNRPRPNTEIAHLIAPVVPVVDVNTGLEVEKGKPLVIYCNLCIHI